MFVVQNVCDEDDADDVGGGGGLYDKGYVSTIQDSVLTLSILNFFLSMMMRMVIRMVTMTIMVFLMTRFVIGVSASTLSIKREHSRHFPPYNVLLFVVVILRDANQQTLCFFNCRQ